MHPGPLGRTSLSAAKWGVDRNFRHGLHVLQHGAMSVQLRRGASWHVQRTRRGRDDGPRQSYFAGLLMTLERERARGRSRRAQCRPCICFCFCFSCTVLSLLYLPAPPETRNSKRSDSAGRGQTGGTRFGLPFWPHLPNIDAALRAPDAPAVAGNVADEPISLR